MRLSKIVIALSSLLVSFTGTAATPLPTASPEKVGFASEGLARIDAFFAREIAADRMPGAAIAIARDGKLVHYRAYGFLNKATGEPMPLEAMFNLASMTKVMTAVGGLTLNEEGRLPLKSRLSEYLPAFAKMNVGVVGTNGEIKLEPASPIYIHDLYRHTSGLTDGGRGDSAVHKLYPSGAAPAAAQYSGEEFLATLAATPGTAGDYTWNGANGTAFWVDPKERLVVVYGTVAPGEIRKYYREQIGALVYGAMLDLPTVVK